MKHYNIPVFIPHIGCPNDCVFCNQKKITGKDTDVSVEQVRSIIESHLKTLPDKNRTVEIAFFGGSFTGIDFDVQTIFLDTAYQYIKSGDVDGIRLSTRPDYIDKNILDQLKKYGVTTIELGVQSLEEKVLIASNRGHTIEDVYNAVKLIKEYDFSLGLQMMTGLPEDTDETALNTAKKIISLSPDFVRIYPTLVLKDTKLEQMYLNGEYVPQELSSAVSLCKELLKLFNNANINVIRIALQTTDEISPNGSLVAGPFNSQFRELVESEIYFDILCDKIRNIKSNNIKIMVNPKEISKITGTNKSNINKIKKIYNINLKIYGDDNLMPYDIKVIEN